MHVLISCFGSAGDVYPFLAIGQALQQRGHRVGMLTSPYFRERIENAGLGFIPIGTLEEYHEAVTESDLWHPLRSFPLLWKYLQRNLPAAYQAIADRATADTVLVGSTLAWNNRLAQEKLGLAGATVHLSPICIFSALDAAVLPGVGWLGHLPIWLIRAFQNGVEGFFLDRTVLPGLNALRAKLELPPVRQVFSHWLNSPQRVICAFPDWFAAPQADWPPNTVTTDFPRWGADAGETLDPTLEGFLESGPPPIGITPGSAMAHGRVMFERALAACAALGLRAVLVSPYREQLPAALPDFAFHVRYAPFDLLLPRLAALVHHGGIGTSAQALAAGIPQLITPWAHDQFDNASRLMRLGVARRIAPASRAVKWKHAMREATSDEHRTRACRHWAQKIREARPAAQRIAEQIETLRR